MHAAETKPIHILQEISHQRFNEAAACMPRKRGSALSTYLAAPPGFNEAAACMPRKQEVAMTREQALPFVLQ